jgi:hypothetical protein
MMSNKPDLPAESNGDSGYEFRHGDDVALYMFGTAPGAESWVVTVQITGHEPEHASRVPAGQHLHPYYCVRATDAVWDVGLACLQPIGSTITIRRSSNEKSLVIPHPGITRRDGKS